MKHLFFLPSINLPPCSLHSPEVSLDGFDNFSKRAHYNIFKWECEMLAPILYEDVDGRYRGLDQNIHVSDGFINHSIFSLWDTYRALHPWMNLTQPERAADAINSMMAHADQSVHGMLPI